MSPARSPLAPDVLLLSASQLKTADECERKWAFSRVIRSQETPAQSLGKDTDDNQLQPLLRDGRALDFTKPSGYIAATALPFVPKPKFKGLEVQKHFKLGTPSGLPFEYQGYIDLWLPEGGAPGLDGVTVADFKTTKSIDKWALTEDGLKEDIQAQLYAIWAMYSTGKRVVNLRWIYMETGKVRRAEARDIVVNANHVAEQFAKIDAKGQRVFGLWEKAPGLGQNEVEEFTAYGLTLEPNLAMCGEYGGCPYKYICNHSPSAFVQTMAPDLVPVVGDNLVATIDLFSKLKAKKDAADAPVAAAPIIEECPPVVFAPESFESGESFTADLVGINPPEKALPPAPAVGAVTAKPKRGRPKKAVDTVAAEGSGEVDETQSTSWNPAILNWVSSDEFETAWAALGVAMKKLLKAVQ